MVVSFVSEVHHHNLILRSLILFVMLTLQLRDDLTLVGPMTLLSTVFPSTCLVAPSALGHHNPASAVSPSLKGHICQPSLYSVRRNYPWSPCPSVVVSFVSEVHHQNLILRCSILFVMLTLQLRDDLTLVGPMTLLSTVFPSTCLVAPNALGHHGPAAAVSPSLKDHICQPSLYSVRRDYPWSPCSSVVVSFASEVHHHDSCPGLDGPVCWPGQLCRISVEGSDCVGSALLCHSPLLFSGCGRSAGADSFHHPWYLVFGSCDCDPHHWSTSCLQYFASPATSC